MTFDFPSKLPDDFKAPGDLKSGTFTGPVQLPPDVLLDHEARLKRLEDRIAALENALTLPKFTAISYDPTAKYATVQFTENGVPYATQDALDHFEPPAPPPLDADGE